MKSFSLLIAVILFFGSCSKLEKSGEKNIIGKWEIVKMSETGGKELPQGVRIEFYDDGTFISNDSQGGEIASGTWNLRKNTSMLLLKDESDVQDISEWKLNIAGYTMLWTGMKDFNTENLKLKFIKVEDQ